MLVHHVTTRVYEYGISHLKVFLIATWIANRISNFCAAEFGRIIRRFSWFVPSECIYDRTSDTNNKTTPVYYALLTELVTQQDTMARHNTDAHGFPSK